MLIDTQAIKKFVTILSQKEVNEIDVKNELLEQIKVNEDYIFALSLDNAMKIQSALNRKNKKQKEERKEALEQRREKVEKEYIGIDIGQSKIITASNMEMDKYIVLKSNKITKEVSKYKNNYKRLKKDKTGENLKNLSKGFTDRVKRYVKNHMFESLNEKFGDDIVYIVGKQSLMTYKYDVQKLLTESIYEVLKEKSQTSDNVIDVVYGNERYTSVTCPDCHTGHPENRKGDKFKCRKCGFEHNNVDIIACRNILEKYKKIYNKNETQSNSEDSIMFKTGEYENSIIPKNELSSIKETLNLEQSGTMDVVRDREKDNSGFTDIDDIIKEWHRKEDDNG